MPLIDWWSPALVSGSSVSRTEIDPSWSGGETWDTINCLWLVGILMFNQKYSLYGWWTKYLDQIPADPHHRASSTCWAEYPPWVEWCSPARRELSAWQCWFSSSALALSPSYRSEDISGDQQVPWSRLESLPVFQPTHQSSYRSLCSRFCWVPPGTWSVPVWDSLFLWTSPCSAPGTRDQTSLVEHSVWSDWSHLSTLRISTSCQPIRD